MARGGRVVVTISTRDETRAGIKRASRNVKGLTNDINKLKLAGVVAFAAISLAVTKSISAFADFDNRVREITTLLGDLDKDIVQKLEDNIINLALSTGQAVDDMAKANYDAISAGFTDAADSTILLEQAARLAVGGVSDVSKTTDLLTSILNSYGESAQSAAKFSDELFTVVRLGKTTIEELASGLGAAIAIAPQLSVSFQDLGAAIATLTAAGQSTDLTLTSLTQVMSKLLKPTEQLEERLLELGFASGKAAIEAVGFAETLKLIASGADEAELAAFFSDVRAIRAVLPLAGTQAEKFTKNLLEMGEAAGAADEAFKRVSEGIGFRLDQINVLFQTALISAGDAFLPLIEAMIGIDGELGNIAARREEIVSFFDDVKEVVTGFVDVMTFLREIAQEPLLITILTKIDPDLESINATIDELNRQFIEGISTGIVTVPIDIKISPAFEEQLNRQLRLAVDIQNALGRVAETVEDFEEFADIDFFAEDLFEDLEENVIKLAKAEQLANENAIKLRNELTTLGAISAIVEQPLESFNLLQTQIDGVTKQLLRLQLQAQTEVALRGIADDKTLENLRQVTNLLGVIQTQANQLLQEALAEKLLGDPKELQPVIRSLLEDVEKLPISIRGFRFELAEVPEEVEEISKALREVEDTIGESLEAGFRSRLIPLAFEISDTIAGAFVDAFGIANTAFGNLVSSILKQATSLAARLGALSLVSLIPGVASFASLIRLAFDKGGIVPQIEGFQAGGIKTTDTVPSMLTPGEAVIPASSVQNNRNIVDSLIASPEPLQSTFSPVQQSSTDINIFFNGFDELSAQRILQSPEFQNTFADIINNGDLKIEVEGKQIEVIK